MTAAFAGRGGHPHLAGSMNTRTASRTPPRGGQNDLFAEPGPAGFRYQPELIGEEEEAELIARLESLPFEPFDFHGHLANRRVVGFGLHYDYGSRDVVEAPAIPGWLLPLRDRAGAFIGQPGDALAHVLINEYRPGAGVGWHRDKAHFDEIVAVSLLSSCDLRFRRKVGEGWDRWKTVVEPRSIYLLSDQARREWEHSVPPVAAHRYSITFRTLRRDPG
jgi:alkylated DNA repair dioxygenase AlkB